VTGQCRDGKRHQRHEQHQHRRHHQQHELVEQVAAKPRTITTTGRRSKSAIGRPKTGLRSSRTWARLHV
jgi:hypothetical protein